MFWICFPTPVEQDCMYDIQKDIQQMISLRVTNMLKVTMSFIRWVGMLLAYLQRTMLSKREFILVSRLQKILQHLRDRYKVSDFPMTGVER